MILANIWGSDVVVRIDPTNGDVLGAIDLSRLKPSGVSRDINAVLNGIAHHPQDPPDVLYVTGKMWTKIFKIRVHE